MSKVSHGENQVKTNRGEVKLPPSPILTQIRVKSCSTSQAETFGRWLFPAVNFLLCFFCFFYSFDTFMARKRPTNYFYCFSVVFNFLFFCNVGWFSSARAFCDIYVVAIENYCKLFFFSNYF